MKTINVSEIQRCAYLVNGTVIPKNFEAINYSAKPIYYHKKKLDKTDAAFYVHILSWRKTDIQHI
jgi:hypothetical protein